MYVCVCVCVCVIIPKRKSIFASIVSTTNFTRCPSVEKKRYFRFVKNSRFLYRVTDSPAMKNGGMTNGNEVQTFI